MFAFKKITAYDCSDVLGKRFSGNGDFVGIAYNNDQVTEVTGYGNHPDGRRAEVKPGTFRSSAASNTIVVDPFPTALFSKTPAFHWPPWTSLAEHFPFVIGREMDSGFADALEEFRRIGEDLLDWNETGALNSFPWSI